MHIHKESERKKERENAHSHTCMNTLKCAHTLTLHECCAECSFGGAIINQFMETDKFYVCVSVCMHIVYTCLYMCVYMRVCVCVCRC